MNKVKAKFISLITIMLLSLGLASVLSAPTTQAISPFGACGGSSSSVCEGRDDNLMKIVRNIINTLLFLVGVIAVIVIIISGIRFVTANGNSDQIASARNGIIYSVVGLAVALMAYAIVYFVIDRIG
ncbi:hypothetical protein KC939_00785 [Candidatus Saccharibacteria bacterium]|nr:hypothetical protein [Candidatus Saccharibacteria bacterium]